jgi:hypothetical protein
MKGRRRKMATPRSVVSEANPNSVQVHTRDELVNELAAVALAMLDKREERAKANKKFNSDIKDLEKRQRELATTIKSTGIRDSIQMKFGSVLPEHVPGDDDEGGDEGN